ncbi:IS630 transposase-related protein [Aggregatibacter actinomycetemcomitans]|uniref:IS630 transposase-related protein n=1 Tax=Aggregatibacter actinomycetemcomitans TaxID=714 RepID=UPI001E5E672B|nr:IS630 transposase-related protein [Aggregatibacter actinomycetemcomitans]
MSYSYQFRLKIIKPVTEQDFGIYEVAKLYKIPHSQVIYWLKAFRERGLDSVKSLYTKPKIKKTQIEAAETTDFSPLALKKLKQEPALEKAEIDYLKKLVELGQPKTN